MEKAPTSSCASDPGGEGLNKSLKAKFDHKCFDKFVFKQNSFREYGQKIGKNPFCLGIANLPLYPLRFFRTNSVRQFCARILGANFAREFSRNSWRKCCAQISQEFLEQILRANFPRILGAIFARKHSRNSWRKFCAQFSNEFLAQILRANFPGILGANFARKFPKEFLAQTLRAHFARKIA